MRRRAGNLWLGCAVTALAAALAGCDPDLALRPAGGPAPAIFDRFAEELTSGLPAGRRIAVRPFKAGETPLPSEAANRFNEALVAALQRRMPGRHTIVARADLTKIIAEADEFAQMPSLQALLAAAQADVLVTGTIRPSGDGVEIAYLAYDPRTGHQVAAARPRFHPADLATTAALPLPAALRALAERLAAGAPDLRLVRPLGIYYQESDIQTVFGRYVAQETVGLLRQRVAGLRADPGAVLPEEFRRLGDIEKEPPERRMLDGPAGVYLLEGSYWELSGEIELRLTLAGRSERRSSHSVRIAAASIPPALLPLAPPATPARADNVGPIALFLSSDRGRRPVYRVGEIVSLAVQASRDAWLYCFNRYGPAGRDQVIRIFPNRYHTDARVRGGAPFHMPGETMNFVLRLHPPAGSEIIRCYALDRDAGPALPRDLAGADLAPLAVNSLDDIGRLLRGIPGMGVSEASLMLTVEAP